MSVRKLCWEVWGQSELLARLNTHQHIFQLFFYRVFAELERAFVQEQLELRKVTIDPGCQWVQPDPKVLSFGTAANVASPDLVLDITVRNRGTLEAVLSNVLAQVTHYRPVPHGIPNDGLLWPKVTYRVSINNGEPGVYENPCEPPLLVKPRSHQRFKVRLTDTGYSWAGTVQVLLDFGAEDPLPLPCIQLCT
jgi:hypothetical protein